MSTKSLGPKGLFERLAAAESVQTLGHGLIIEHSFPLSKDFQKSLLGFLAYLGCNQAKGSAACGICESCTIFSPDAFEGLPHPDIQIIKAANENGDYTVDEIKELRRFFGLARAVSRNRVICILGAEGLSGQGSAPANALLKILEEPRPQSFLVLCTRDLNSLLATIRSRCQAFKALEPVPNRGLQVSDDWKSLEQWLITETPGWSLPGDLPPFDDSFWKDRESATQELRLVREQLWLACHGSWGRWSLEHARKAIDFFNSFEDLLYRLDSHGNAGLQWLAFSRNAIPDRAL